MKTLEKIILRCKEADPCQTEFKKLIACQNIQEAWVVLADNMWWVFENNILDMEDWKELLDAGVDCTADDNAAIFWAAHKGHTEIVTLLMQHGAKL